MPPALRSRAVRPKHPLSSPLPALGRRTPRASRVETAQLVLPGLTNVHGTIFGGILMQWIDIAAGIAAARHSGGPVVTASMDRLHFLDPVQLGEVVVLQAQVNFAARTSMEVGVRVMCENQTTFTRRQTTRAYLTFVAVDENGRPRPVPRAAPRDRRRAPPLRRRATPPGRAVARTARYEEGLMPITTDVALLAKDAVLGPAAAPPRELVVATGVDRIRFLHGLVTGNVAGTEPGRGCRAALLDPQGAGGQRPADLRPPGRRPDRRRRRPGGAARHRAGALRDHGRLRRRARAGVFTLLAARSRPRPPSLAAAGVDVGALATAPPLAHVEVGSFWIARVRELGADGFWIGGAPSDVASLRERLATGVPELDAAVAEAARIDALEPRFGAEITADYFPMEVGLAGAIDYTKGCYLGQEPIVRVRDRGHINWRLCGLDIVGAVDPHPGDALTSDLKPKAGQVTSAARLPDGRGVALAMAHVSLPVGATVHIGADAIEARIRAEVP